LGQVATDPVVKVKRNAGGTPLLCP